MLSWGLWRLIIFSATHIHFRCTQALTATYSTGPPWCTKLSVCEAKEATLWNNAFIWLPNKQYTTKLLFNSAASFEISAQSWWVQSGGKVWFTNYYSSKTQRSTRFTRRVKSAQHDISTPKPSDWKAAIVDWWSLLQEDYVTTEGTTAVEHKSRQYHGYNIM